LLFSITKFVVFINKLENGLQACQNIVYNLNKVMYIKLVIDIFIAKLFKFVL